MPVDFLTAEQTQRYGRFHGDPSPTQLAKYFFLDDNDRAEITSHRGAHNRLGYAVQLCTVRFLGTFLPDPLNVPRLVIKHLAEQLAITDLDCLTRYRDRRPTHHEHVEQIRQRHGYCDFADQPEHWRLMRWLYTRSSLSAERPVVLFDLATARMVERKVLLPGATTLARMVASVSDRAAMRLWRSLAELPNRNQRKRLEGLLTVPDTENVSALDRLRRPSVHISAPGMVDALGRLSQFQGLGVTNVKLVNVPAGRVKVAGPLRRGRQGAIHRPHAERPPSGHVAGLRTSVRNNRPG